MLAPPLTDGGELLTTARGQSVPVAAGERAGAAVLLGGTRHGEKTAGAAS